MGLGVSETMRTRARCIRVILFCRKALVTKIILCEIQVKYFTGENIPIYGTFPRLSPIVTTPWIMTCQLNEFAVISGQAAQN